MENKFTTKQIAEILEVTDKSVRRYLNSYFTINKGAYEVSEKMLSILKNDYLGQQTDSLRTNEAPLEPLTENESFENGRIEYFTDDEYQEFQKRLSEYPFLKERAEFLLNDLEYYRKSMTSKERQMELILLAITNKRFLEEEN